MSVFATQNLNNFFSKYKKYRYKKGEIILRGGDAPQGVYFIHKGYVRDYSISKDGEELTLIIFKPEDFFPMNWVFNDNPNLHYFEAMTAVELWRCPKKDFTVFLKANPDVFFELSSHVTLRLGGLLQRMEYLAFGNAYEKVASILMICAERFGEKSDRGIRIPIPLTHKDLAMLVGMTRETVSIEIKKLERKGIVEDDKRSIIITSMRRLKSESLDGGATEQ
ncbi:MAG: CarD family transcriptional regulator [Candidatus Levybacteria bacterium]|nr:CarD family transcriptional regulator [Candidatus Levybacteria bacterium]